MPLVWQSVLRKGGSQMTWSKLPLSSAAPVLSYTFYSKMPDCFTRKVQWRPEIVVDEFLEHAEPGIILEEMDLGDFICSSRLHDQLDELCARASGRTSRFFNWIKTLGAETTAIRVFVVALWRSSFARRIAVSSLYWTHQNARTEERNAHVPRIGWHSNLRRTFPSKVVHEKSTFALRLSSPRSVSPSRHAPRRNLVKQPRRHPTTLCIHISSWAR